jgi:hypothetical protein
MVYFNQDKARGDRKMTNLTGSEKQIAWAEKIRKETLEIIDAKKKHFRKDYIPEIDTAVDIALQQTSAKWWIETGRIFNSMDSVELLVDTINKTRRY